MAAPAPMVVGRDDPGAPFPQNPSVQARDVEKHTIQADR